MNAHKWLGLSLVIGLALTGCSAPSADSPAAGSTPSPTPTNSYPSVETLGIEGWSTVDAINWAPPADPVAGWGAADVSALGSLVGNWMKAATTDPSMWSATDPIAAVDIIAGAMPPVIGNGYRDWRLANQPLILAGDGWSFTPGVTMLDSRHDLGWDFKTDLMSDGETGALTATAVLKSAWLLQEGAEEPVWAMTVREVYYTSATPSSVETGRRTWNSVAFTVNADHCDFMGTGQIAPSYYRPTEPDTFLALTEPAAGTFMTVEDLQAELGERADAKAAEDPTSTPEPLPAC
jgi:hypothetical protein